MGMGRKLLQTAGQCSLDETPLGKVAQDNMEHDKASVGEDMGRDV